MADQEESATKISKGQLKKQAKKEAKEQAKAEKAAANETPSEASTDEAPRIGDETTLQFGTYPIVQSTRVTSREFSNICDLNEALDEKIVWVRARIFTSRSKGSLKGPPVV